MKIALVVAASAVALMSGCATTTPPVTIAQASVTDNVDYARVAAVNNAARAQGVLIQWIHYPQSKKAAVGIAPTLAEPTGT
jgi:hypothetical protein